MFTFLIYPELYIEFVIVDDAGKQYNRFMGYCNIKNNACFVYQPAPDKTKKQLSTVKVKISLKSCR